MKIAKSVLVLILALLMLNLTSSELFGFDALQTISANFKNDKDTYAIIVDLDDHILYLYKGDELLKKYPVSGGKYTTPSPLGTWKITSEANWGEGFGGTWMGFNVPCPT